MHCKAIADFDESSQHLAQAMVAREQNSCKNCLKNLTYLLRESAKLKTVNLFSKKVAKSHGLFLLISRNLLRGIRSKQKRIQRQLERNEQAKLRTLP